MHGLGYMWSINSTVVRKYSKKVSCICFFDIFSISLMRNHPERYWRGSQQYWTLMDCVVFTPVWRSGDMEVRSSNMAVHHSLSWPNSPNIVTLRVTWHLQPVDFSIHVLVIYFTTFVVQGFYTPRLQGSAFPNSVELIFIIWPIRMPIVELMNGRLVPWEYCWWTSGTWSRYTRNTKTYRPLGIITFYLLSELFWDPELKDFYIPDSKTDLWNNSFIQVNPISITQFCQKLNIKPFNSNKTIWFVNSFICNFSIFDG